MPLLRVQLLGGFEIRGADDRDLTPSSRKACGILACLALPPGAAWSRDQLAATFWSERGEEQARGSIRQALTDLRHSLGPGTIQQVERDAVMLDPGAVIVDAMEFEQAVKVGELERAAALYRGDLLDRFTLHSSGFHDWLLVERTRPRDLAVDALTRLAASQSGGAAIETCQRLLQIDPTREEAHRRLMSLYAGQDQRALALRQFQICRDILQRELDTKPDPETEALFRQLQKPKSHSMPPLSIDLEFPSPPSEMPSIVVLPDLLP
jgi:DNA-binding SARP family transcriptional activator